MRRKPVPRRSPLGLALRRHPRWRTAASIIVALLCGGVVAATVHEADAARAAWGRSTTVLVAARDLAPGEAVDAGNTRREQHPGPLVPPDAITELPAGGRVTAAVYEGEVLREARLTDAASAVAARLPPGSRAVAIPVEPGTTPPLSVGDRVEVLVALPPEAAGGGPPGFSLATDVPVVEITDEAVTIAVDEAVAPRLAVAFGQGAVTLALLGPGGGSR
jgi:Flp pilus assembly protein CpaB